MWTGLAALGLAFLLIGCSPPGRRELLEAQRHLQHGRAEAAVAPLREAIRVFSTNHHASAQAWNYLGIAYHQLGQAENAALCYKAALDLDLNLLLARYNRGFLFFERTNYAAAIGELTTYTTQLPDDPSGWLLLGKAQLRAGQIEPAQHSLQRVRRLPAAALQHAEALNALGVSYARRRRAVEAFQHLEAALNRVADYPPAILNQALLSQQLNDRGYALQKFQAYLEVAPNSPRRDAIGTLTNELSVALAASRPAARPPAVTSGTNPPPDLSLSNVVAAAPTSPPPALVQTTAPLTLVRTAAPPAFVQTSAPPMLAQATPPRTLTQTAPTPVPAAQGQTSPPPGLVATSLPTVTAHTSAPPTELARREPPPVAVAPAPASAEPPRTTTAVATSPEPAVEMVRLEAEPAFQPARDLAVASAPPTTNQPVAEPSTTVQPSGTSEPSPESAAEEPEKRSFFARLNPVSWFGSKGSDAEREQARAAEAQAEEEEKARRAAKKEAQRREAEQKETERARQRAADAERRAARPVPPLPTAATPSTSAFPRYHYLSPPAPSRGNRAASDRLVAEGVRAHQAGRTGDAQALYAKAVQADPANFNAQFNLAVAAFDLRDWTRSLATYENALAISPEDSRARYGLALTLERAGYPLDAADELERLLAKEPTHVEAHLAAANLYATTLANPTKAREHYLRVLELQPAHPQAGMIRRWLGPAPR